MEDIHHSKLLSHGSHGKFEHLYKESKRIMVSYISDHTKANSHEEEAAVTPGGGTEADECFFVEDGRNLRRWLRVSNGCSTAGE